MLAAGTNYVFLDFTPDAIANEIQPSPFLETFTTIGRREEYYPQFYDFLDYDRDSDIDADDATIAARKITRDVYRRLRPFIKDDDLDVRLLTTMNHLESTSNAGQKFLNEKIDIEDENAFVIYVGGDLKSINPDFSDFRGFAQQGYDDGNHEWYAYATAEKSAEFLAKEHSEKADPDRVHGEAMTSIVLDPIGTDSQSVTSRLLAHPNPDGIEAVFGTQDESSLILTPSIRIQSGNSSFLDAKVQPGDWLQVSWIREDGNVTSTWSSSFRVGEIIDDVTLTLQLQASDAIDTIDQQLFDKWVAGDQNIKVRRANPITPKQYTEEVSWAITHELGHLLGLGHICTIDAIGGCPQLAQDPEPGLNLMNYKSPPASNRFVKLPTPHYTEQFDDGIVFDSYYWEKGVNHFEEVRNSFAYDGDAGEFAQPSKSDIIGDTYLEELVAATMVSGLAEPPEELSDFTEPPPEREQPPAASQGTVGTTAPGDVAATLSAGFDNLRQNLLDDISSQLNLGSDALPVMSSNISDLFGIEDLLTSIVTSVDVTSAGTMSDLNDQLTAAGFIVDRFIGDTEFGDLSTASPADFIQVSRSYNLGEIFAKTSFTESGAAAIGDLSSLGLSGELGVGGQALFSITMGVDTGGFYLLPGEAIRLRTEALGALGITLPAAAQAEAQASAYVVSNLDFSASHSDGRIRLDELSDSFGQHAQFDFSGGASLAVDLAVDLGIATIPILGNWAWNIDGNGTTLVTDFSGFDDEYAVEVLLEHVIEGLNDVQSNLSDGIEDNLATALPFLSNDVVDSLSAALGGAISFDEEYSSLEQTLEALGLTVVSSTSVAEILASVVDDTSLEGDLLQIRYQNSGTEAFAFDVSDLTDYLGAALPPEFNLDQIPDNVVQFTANLAADVDLTIAVNAMGEFVVVDRGQSQGDEFQLTASIDMSIDQIGGEVGPLQLGVNDGTGDLSLTMSLDFVAPSSPTSGGSIPITEVITNFAGVTDTNVDATSSLVLPMAIRFGDNGPGLVTSFSVFGETQSPIQFTFGPSKTSDPQDGFAPIEYELGDFVDGLISPVIDRANFVKLIPARLNDRLTRNLPIVNQKPIDLLIEYDSGGNYEAWELLVNLGKLAQDVGDILASGNQLDLSSYGLGPAPANPGSGSAEGGSTSFFDDLEAELLEYHITLPFMDNLDVVIKDAIFAPANEHSLIEWNPPPMSLSTGAQTIVDIPLVSWGIPLVAEVRGSFIATIEFSLNADLGFGFSTRGLTQTGTLLDGFFLDDQDESAGLKPEFFGSLDVNAGVEGSVILAGEELASLTASGGLNISIGADLVDVDATDNLVTSEASDNFRVHGDELSTIINDPSLGRSCMFVLTGAMSPQVTVGYEITNDALKATARLARFPVENSWTKRFPGFNWNSDPCEKTQEVPLADAVDNILLMRPINSSKPGQDINVRLVRDGVGNPTHVYLSIKDDASGAETLYQQFEIDPSDGRVRAMTSDGQSQIVDSLEIVGTEFNDYITIDPEVADYFDGYLIRGYDGDDIIELGNGTMAPTRLVSTLVLAGNGADQVYGTPVTDIVSGGKGNDSIYGFGGNDDLRGEDDDDYIDGGDGLDVINGGDGEDTLHGGDHRDTINGGRHDDVIKGGLGNDTVHGNGGDDLIFGGDDHDQLFGDHDLLTGVQGDEGDDVILGNDGNDTIHGGIGHDFLYGDHSLYLRTKDDGTGPDCDVQTDPNTGEQYIYSYCTSETQEEWYVTREVIGGDDWIEGGDGDDWIEGGNGNDDLFGGIGNDAIFGSTFYHSDAGISGNSSGNDHVQGGIGDDRIGTSSGNDFVFGGAGVDTITTGEGNDHVDGGDDNDEIDGGRGTDVLMGGDGNDRIFGGLGDDEIRGGIGDDALFGGDRHSPFGSGNDQIDGGEGDDSISAGDGNDELIGGPGEDDLNGDQGDDNIDGGTGNDTIRGGEGNDDLKGGPDDDHISGDPFDGSFLAPRWTDKIDGGDGDDTISGGRGDDEIVGGWGRDTIYGGYTGNEGFRGSPSDSNTIYGDRNDAATMPGLPSDHQDLIYGGAGPDFIEGAFGDDRIYAAEGNDTLTGGQGNDLVQGHDGDDLIFVHDGDGSDVLDGGDGYDVVKIHGNDGASDSISITPNGDRVQLARTNLDLYTIDMGTIELIDLEAHGGDDVVAAGAGLDITLHLDGGAGNDALTGGDSADILRGGANDDTLVGGRGDDQVFGQSGNDLFIVNHGDNSDLLEGGDGNDTAQVNGSENAGDIFAIDPNGDRVRFAGTNLDLFTLDIGTIESLDVNSLGGDDLVVGNAGLAGLILLDLDGGDGKDELRGGDGDDKIFGGADGDTLIGGPGDDQVFGQDGDDVSFVNDGDGSDLIEGGEGFDRLFVNGALLAGDDFSIEPNGARVAFDRNNLVPYSLDIGTTEHLNVSGHGGHDVITGNVGLDGLILLSLFGGSGNDEIQGGDGNDVIHGGANEDLIQGNDGDDNIFGGDGDDNISGGAGNDEIHGGANDDSIQGGDGDDTIFGDEGNDNIGGGDGNDEIHGGSEDDVIVGDQGSDQIHGDGGDDRIHGGDDGDTIFGGEGNDTIRGELGNDELHGGRGSDVIYAGQGADQLFGDEANDQLYGDLGDDQIDGGDGADTIFGGDGNDLIDGGPNADWIEAGSGVDTVSGGIGDDIILGQGGNDDLSGDQGDDFIHGGEGVDLIRGGADNDVLVAGAGIGDQLFGGDGDDTITGSSDGMPTDPDFFDTQLFGDVIDAGPGNDTVFGLGGADLIRGGDGDDHIESGSGSDYVLAGAGQDWVFVGHDLGETVYAGEGNDTVYGSHAGEDELFGEDGNDDLFGQGGNDTLSGGLGDDVIDGGAGADVVNGDDGNDELLGGGGAGDQLNGGAGNDIIRGSDDGGDVIYAGIGRDTVFAGGGNDEIHGEEGDDRLHGGPGDDLIVGGPGRDLITGDGDHDVLFGHSVSNLNDDNAVDYVYGDFGTDGDEPGSGRDQLDGGGGNDLLFGEGDDDSLVAGSGGSDLLDYGSGETAVPTDFVAPIPTADPIVASPSPLITADATFPTGVTDRGRWTEFSGSASGRGISNHPAGGIEPSVIVAEDGTRYVAWVDGRSGNEEIYVAKHTDTSGWQSVGGGAEAGGVSNSPGASRRPSLALDTDGSLVVAWTEISPAGSDIQASRFDAAGDSWIDIGPSRNVSGSSAADEATIVRSTEGLVLAWIDRTSGMANGYVRRFDGSVWTELAGSATGTGITSSISDIEQLRLAVDTGTIAVSWTQHIGDHTQIYVKEFAGIDWQELAGSASGNGASQVTTAAFDSTISYLNGQLFIGWVEADGPPETPGTRVRVARYSGNVWSDATPAALTPFSSATRQPRLASGGQQLYFAWTPQLATQVFVARWDGIAFVEELPGDATDEGIQETAAASNLSISVNGMGQPHAVWQDQSSGENPQIFLRGDRSMLDLNNRLFIADGSPGKSISELLAANDFGPGDTILVSGSHAEHVTIDTNDAGLSIIGAPAAEILGNVSVSAADVVIQRLSMGNLVASNADRFTLRESDATSVTISGGTDAQIVHVRASQVTLESGAVNSIVERNQLGHLSLDSALSAQVRFNRINGGGHGIEVLAVSTGEIAANEVFGHSIGLAISAPFDGLIADN